MVAAVMDGWWTEGKYAAEFERRLADFFGLKHLKTVFNLNFTCFEGFLCDLSVSPPLR
jgi:hypothetical protein